MTAPREAGERPWFPPDPAPTPRRLRKHALADTLRALVADVTMLDVEAADERQLTLAEQRLQAAKVAIAALPDHRATGLWRAGDDSSLFEHSPLSGRSNALAAPLVMVFEGELTRAHATYGEAYEGPPTCVHGGYVISAFDDLLGVAQAASGIAGLTGTLSVRLHRPTPLGRRIDYEAGVREVTGRKITAWGQSTLDGQLLAEATGVFVVPRGGHPSMVLREEAGLAGFSG